MKAILKKYWLLFLIIITLMNASGYYCIKNAPDFLDIYEHAESEAVLQTAWAKEYLYAIFLGWLVILNGCLAVVFLLLLSGILLNVKVLTLSKK